MACKNCMGGCIHCKTEEQYEKVEHKDENGNIWAITNDFLGYKRHCTKNPDGYIKWHNKHKHETYNQYCTSVMECYEPNETMSQLADMENIMIDLLNLVKNKRI